MLEYFLNSKSSFEVRLDLECANNLIIIFFFTFFISFLWFGMKNINPSYAGFPMSNFTLLCTFDSFRVSLRHHAGKVKLFFRIVLHICLPHI